MKTELKTLVLAPVDNDVDRYRRALKQVGIACNTRRVATAFDFQKQLGEFAPDLIIAVLARSDCDGLAALKVARRDRPDTPFIFVSGSMSEGQAVELLENGATDCIHEEHLTRFTHAVLRALKEAENHRQQRQQEEKLTRLSRIYAILSGINSLIVRVRDRQELFEGACKIAAGVGNFGIAWIGLFDANALTVTPVAWAGRDAEHLAYLPTDLRDSSPGATGLIARALREKRAVFSNDLAAEPDPESERRRQAMRLGYRAMITLPFIVQDAVVGNLTLYASEPDIFNQDELKLLNELAGNISLSLEHIGKEEKIARLSRIHAVMSNINSLIVRVRDRQELFNEACRIAVDHGGFGTAWIGSFEAATRTITPIAWNGLDSESLLQNPSKAWSSALTQESVVGRAMREKRAVFDNDITLNAEQSGSVRQEAIRRGYRSLIALPLLVQGEAVGNLSIFAREPNFFNQDEVRLLSELARDISFALEYIEKEERIVYLAYHDVLTGLPNRHLITDRLMQAISHSKRSGCLTAIAFIDLDHFKLINDSLGHNAGDQLLQAIAKRLISCTRDGDTVARLGGDEFVLVLPDQPDIETTTIVMQRILESVKQPVGSGDSEMHTACSIGVALYPQDGSDVETLLKNADAAMYRAKESGRNTLKFYAGEMNAKVNERLLIESKLRRAVERNELFLNYQPQIDLQSGRIIGVEALVRWRNPDIGVVPPDRFIPLAEESDLILSIGDWVIREACVQNKAWQTLGLPAISVSVNVSARQFRQAHLPEKVAQILCESGLEPRHLNLELTESVVMHNVESVIATMRKFESMGVELSIDDFGTGYSSLSYLKRFPVSKLKIDQSFVRDLASDPDDAAIAQSVISLAHSLGLKVIAEGVENEEQIEFLRARGCDEVQGYYFSKPVAAEQLRELLLRPRCLPAAALNFES